jgi:multidrug transporter EmrE-like cation transporter
VDNVIYDSSFNANEWYAIIMILAGGAVILVLPKRFTPAQTAFNLMIGVVFGLMFDHTIAVPPFDLYDVGDEAEYQVFDMFSYAMYMPSGYLFIYFWDRWGLRGFKMPVYIAIWAGAGTLVEWIGVLVGVFHYKNGYQLAYSVPIYLIVETCHLGLYILLFKRKTPPSLSK